MLSKHSAPGPATTGILKGQAWRLNPQTQLPQNTDTGLDSSQLIMVLAGMAQTHISALK